MKLVRYGVRGQEKPGLVDSAGRLRDLSGVVQDIGGETLSPSSLDRLRELDPLSLPLMREDVRLGAPVHPVSKVVGVGMNYRGHAEAAGVPIPERPVLFIKPSTTISGPFDDTIIPPGATKLDWEVELGVVIGSPARNVLPDQAMSVVAGFVIVDDITERGWITESGQLTDGKCADGLTPIGPWVVTHDEVPDYRGLELSLDIDGVRRQVGMASDMIFTIPDLIARITARMTLLPGDIISTGTPWGIGHRCTPPIYLQAGNIVEMRISGLGQQRRLVRGCLE